MSGDLTRSKPSGVWPCLTSFIRLPLLLLGNAVVILVYRRSGHLVGLEAGLAWSTLTLTIVNLMCVGLLIWRFRVERISVRRLVGFERATCLRDVLAGVVLSFALATLMMIGVAVSVLLRHPTEGFQAFEHCFVGDGEFSLELPMWLAVFSAIVFPCINAPVEELQYRGYSRIGLERSTNRPAVAGLVTSLGFGMQHAAFSLTTTAAIAYTVGFFLWGLGASWVASRQERLIRLIVAHYVSNLSFGVIPLVIVLTQ